MAIPLQVNVTTNKNLLAMPVGIKQKENVDDIVQKVLHLVLLTFKSDELHILSIILLNSVSCSEFYHYFIPL